MTPTASPRYATKLTPRIAATSRIDPRDLRPRIRSSAVDAVPRSPPAPYTRYTTCRSSTTTVGSATAVEHLLAPEEGEAAEQREYRPAGADLPQVAGDERCRAVTAVQRVTLAVSPGEAPSGTDRPGAERAAPLHRQQRVPHQRDEHIRRV